MSAERGPRRLLGGKGLGEALVREMLERGPLAHARWLLHTEDMHRLYRRLGFEDASYKVLERPPRSP